MIREIVLGVVQGLGEFLPISSSAHLILVPWFLDWPDQGLTHDVALHFGTLIAVAIYFRSDWAALITRLFRLLKSPKIILQLSKADFETRLGVFIVLATAPGVIAGLLLEKKAETVFRSPGQVGAVLGIMGVVLWVADYYGRKSKDIKSMTWKKAVLIGISQGFAVVPGVSRSGSTITAGLCLGLSRESAARFSFLLSLPITLGACLLKARDLTASDMTSSFFMGIGISFISGWFAIDILLKLVKGRSFGVFAVYRLLLASCVFMKIYFS